MRPTLQERFDSKTNVHGPIARVPLTPCHQWQACASGGYGLLRVAGKGVLVHRLAYKLAFGDIPEGMCVCHTCDNGLCVNPSHLFLGTHADNMHDRDAKGRASGGSERGETHHLAKLSDADFAEIRMQYAKIAAKYGISREHVGDIVRNQARVSP